MLETQNDTKVPGYMCDSASRTITPQLPDHPSQIKGIRSANDQMFTYSSWLSRSWLIVRGAQPAIQQQVGLHALKRLYEAKGFNPDLLKNVRRRVEPNERVDPICIVGVFAHLRLLMCDCVHVCMVWSWLGLCGCLFVCAYPSIGMASVHPIQLEVADSTRRSPHAVYTVSSLLRPAASSTAMRGSFSYRRTAWCICGMFRATAPRAPPMRCKTGQHTCAHAPQCLNDLPWTSWQIRR